MRMAEGCEGIRVRIPHRNAGLDMAWRLFLCVAVQAEIERRRQRLLEEEQREEDERRKRKEGEDSLDPDLHWLRG